MNHVGFHPEARAEFLKSVRYYEDQQPGLGRRFLDAVRYATSRIAQFPDAGPVLEPGIRQFRVQRYPFGLVYRHRPDGIEVVAVMHLHRQPGYWRERLG